MIVPEPQLPKGLDALYEITDELVASGVRLHQIDLSGLIAKSVMVERAVWSRLKLTGSKLAGLQLRDVEVGDCDLSNANWPGCSLHRVRVSKCRMTGFSIPEAVIGEVLFEDCRLDLANFRFCRMETVCFNRCDLRGADFFTSAIKFAAFSNCEMEGASFDRNTLQDVDLRTSNLVGLKVGGLAGAIVDTGQMLDLAPQLAALAGLQIRDGD